VTIGRVPPATPPMGYVPRRNTSACTGAPSERTVPNLRYPIASKTAARTATAPPFVKLDRSAIFWNGSLTQA